MSPEKEPDEWNIYYSVTARYRKRVKKPIISRSRIEKLMDIGTEMILSGTLNQNQYTEEMIGIAYSSRRK